MRETVEFRVPEENARAFLPAGVGKVMGSALDIELFGPSVRQVIATANSPLYEQIGELSRRFRKEGKFFYHGWITRRTYSKREIEAAELFQLTPRRAFEPAGEECGTIYDESSVCPRCGAGRRRVGLLVLDTRKIPKSVDIARTIADEIVISQRFADLLLDSGATGIFLEPVMHKTNTKDEPFDLTKSEAGRALIARARREGIEDNSWEFTVWLNRPEQDELASEAERQSQSGRLLRIERRNAPRPTWYTPIVESLQVRMHESTECGIKPFYPDEKGDHRCDECHTAGLNLLSELYVERDSYDGSDIAATRELVGIRMGLLVPCPILVVSPRLRQIMLDNDIKGAAFEVAYLYE